MTLMTERAPLPTGTWSIDAANSRVEFQITQFGMSSVRGAFTEFEGALELGNHFAAAHGFVSVASLDTQQSRRDSHLRSPAFFDAERHPKLVFESTEIRHLDADSLEIVGNLTMRGATRPITLSAQAQTRDGRVLLTVTGQLNRHDYGVTPNPLLDAVVSDRVTFELDLSAVKAA